MVRYKVNEYFHPLRMGAINQLFKFEDPVLNIRGEIRINIIIVFDGIRRPCSSLNNICVI